MKNNEESRIFPGDLAVSRTFGDVFAKVKELGGKHNVILGIPDILGFKIDYNLDFLIMGSHGIYNKITNKDLIINVIETCIEAIKNKNNKEKFVKSSIQNILNLCIDKGSKENISCIIFFFENFMNYFEKKNTEFLNERLNFLKNSSFI